MFKIITIAYKEKYYHLSGESPLEYYADNFIIAKSCINDRGIIKATNLNNSEYNIINDKIFCIEKSDKSGIFHDITAEFIPDIDKRLEYFQTKQPEIFASVDNIRKKNLVLSWNERGIFHIDLFSFFSECTKTKIKSVLDMIEKFSKNVEKDLENFMFSLDRLKCDSKRRHNSNKTLDNFRDYIVTSKLYISVFGSSAAEAVLNPEMTLKEFEKGIYQQSSGKGYKCISRDIPCFISGDKHYALRAIYGHFKAALTAYFDKSYNGYFTAEKVLNAVIYLCTNRGVNFVYRLKNIPDSIDDIENAVIIGEKPKRGSYKAIDFDSEKAVISDLLSDLLKSRDIIANTDDSAAEKELEKGLEKDLESGVENVVDSDISENVVESVITESPIENTIDSAAEHTTKSDIQISVIMPDISSYIGFVKLFSVCESVIIYQDNNIISVCAAEYAVISDSGITTNQTHKKALAYYAALEKAFYNIGGAYKIPLAILARNTTQNRIKRFSCRYMLVCLNSRAPPKTPNNYILSFIRIHSNLFIRFIRFMI